MEDTTRQQEKVRILTKGQRSALLFIAGWYIYMWIQEWRGTMILSTWGSLPIIGICQGALIGGLALLLTQKQKRLNAIRILGEDSLSSRMKAVGYAVLLLLSVVHWYVVIRSPEVLRPMQIRTIILLSALMAGYEYWRRK